ncbi:hypothetical protein T4E_4905 [Trichinella pseudospiralis]|uniref:Uncharacterized protein n=1 Tax=Trichinella pseudospiralis TaxID=6337 RepID=A0A0V0XNJ7_TRIPS|nr:hypothetical protein T4E_4905 [Trichinella pseudospiralis]
MTQIFALHTQNTCRATFKDVPARKREYTAVIKEYLRNGWAEEVSTQIVQPGKTRYFFIIQHTNPLMIEQHIRIFDGTVKYGVIVQPTPGSIARYCVTETSQLAVDGTGPGSIRSIRECLMCPDELWPTAMKKHRWCCKRTPVKLG